MCPLIGIEPYRPCDQSRRLRSLIFSRVDAGYIGMSDVGLHVNTIKLQAK